MIGIVTPRPSMSRATWPARGSPPFSTIAEICGKVGEVCAISTPSTTSGRSPGVITAAPSNSRSRTFGIVIAATTRPVTSRLSRDSSPLARVPSTAVSRSATEGALSSGSSGMANAGTTSVPSASTSLARSSALTRLAMIANSEPWFAWSSPTAMSVTVWRSSAVRPAPLSTRRTGAPRLAAIRAL